MKTLFSILILLGISFNAQTIQLSEGDNKIKIDKEIKPRAWCLGMVMGAYKNYEIELVDDFNAGYYEDKPDLEQEHNRFMHYLKNLTTNLNEELKIVEELVCPINKSPCYAVSVEQVDKAIKFMDDLAIETTKDRTIWDSELLLDMRDNCLDYINDKELS
tara:strand:- start:15 stop:494 length:480 start_codon:yes stop_codon:yes gene_type:complete